YALGVIAFVGGSLVPVGGHNVLEPARAGRPVLVGPHTEHAADTVERLIAGGAALRVSSAESLAWALAGLLDEPARLADLGRRARCARRWRPRRSPTARSRRCATVSTMPAGSTPRACPRTW